MPQCCASNEKIQVRNRSSYSPQPAPFAGEFTANIVVQMNNVVSVQELLQTQFVAMRVVRVEHTLI